MPVLVSQLEVNYILPQAEYIVGVLFQLTAVIPIICIQNSCALFMLHFVTLVGLGNYTINNFAHQFFAKIVININKKVWGFTIGIGEKSKTFSLPVHLFEK